MHRSKEPERRRRLHPGHGQRSPPARSRCTSDISIAARAYRRAGDFDKAVSDFTKVLELKPGFARAYEARGMTEDDRGNRDKALADIDEAIKHDDKAWQLLYSRAVVLRADGDTDGALRDLDAASDLNAEAANIPLMRALVLADKGSYAAARDRDQPRPFRGSRRRLGALRARRCRLRGGAHRRSRRGCRPRARARRRLCRRAHAEGPYSRRARRQCRGAHPFQQGIERCC